MAAGWFITRGDGQNKSGPYSSQQLKQLADQGKLQPTDLLWKEGMTTWKPAGEVKGLYPTAAPVSPPLHPPVAPLIPQPQSDQPGSPLEFDSSPENTQSNRYDSDASPVVWLACFFWATALGLLGGIFIGVLGGILGVVIGVPLGWMLGQRQQQRQRVERWRAKNEEEEKERIGAKVRRDLQEEEKCPHCQMLDAREFVREEEIGRRTAYETRTVQSPIRDGPFSSSPITGYIDMPTNVPVEEVRFRAYYRCRYCSHQWTVDGPWERGPFTLPEMRRVFRQKKPATATTVIADFQVRGEMVYFSVVGQTTQLPIHLRDLDNFMKDPRYFINPTIRARLGMQFGRNYLNFT